MIDKASRAMGRNRRVFFRIYEEANLIYKKIDKDLLTGPHLVFDDKLNDFILPGSYGDIGYETQAVRDQPEKVIHGGHFNEHETINVNISAGGMAFNCDEDLKDGDFLAIRLLLDSADRPIVTYGKVVYCMNNPADFEFPYFIGAHFYGMDIADRELLSRYIDKKRSKQWKINAVILAVLIIVLSAPDVVFGLLGELLHFLFEHFVELMHLSFEALEITLDHLVEHAFHTEVHDTQIIVFYILVAMAIYGLRRLWRVVPPFVRYCKRSLLTGLANKKAGLQFFWREQSTFGKIKLIAIGITALICYFYLGF